MVNKDQCVFLLTDLETDQDISLTDSLCKIHYTLVGFLLSCFTVLFTDEAISLCLPDVAISSYQL